MTITINVPVFPMRKEIADLKQRRGWKLGNLSLPHAFTRKPAAPRYSQDGLEFDVGGVEKPHGSQR